MPYVKLDCGLLDSSLWCEDPITRITFITMLAMANSEGLCEATAPGIARRGNLPIDQVRTALERLEGPDPDDRSGVDEGRRIKRVAGGYQMVNYMLYREKDHTNAARCKRYREKHSDTTTRVSTMSQHADMRVNMQAKAEVEVKETTSFNAKGSLVKPAPARDPAAPALGTAGPTAPCLEKKATELQQPKTTEPAKAERPIACDPAQPAEVKQPKPSQDTPRPTNAPRVAFPLKRRAVPPEAFARWNVFAAILRGQGWAEEHVRRIVRWAARDYRSGAWSNAPADVCWRVLGWAAYVRVNASRTDGKGQHVDDPVAFLVSLAAQPRPPQELFLKQARRAWERAETQAEQPPAWLTAALEGIGNGPGARRPTSAITAGATAAAVSAAAGVSGTG